MKHTTVMMSAVVAASLLSTSALALDRANTSEKGSLLVFPNVDVSGDRNTIIRLQNDYSDSVSLKCYWKNGTKFFTDFQIELTKFQPIWISARDGEGTYSVPPFPTSANQDYLDKIGHSGGPYATPSRVTLPEHARTAGELQCWAVDGGGASEIRWNHLAGSATVVDASQGTAYQYNAWGFRCLVGGNGDACVVADAGQLDLNGNEYEACPKKLIGHFSPAETALGGMQVHRNELTLASCNQDLTQDQQFHFTKLKFNVWNEQEAKYTGAYQCMDSWHQGLLDGVQNNGRNFTASSLKTDVARFKVRGMKSSVCERADNRKTFAIDESIVTEEAGLLGVMATTYGLGESDGLAEAGTTLHMLGQRDGFIAYDPQEVIEERPAR
ncbi:hypothetical protein Noc_0973 [Nitrosococcus oceani ATCC 19707]|uniref:Uncharacterized protein n=1 Tax=Nitrosococcus oceani (strain ATCC 19707 / BCRC 17464 / JCM 30415 / NCIMB 11848 / C-107) TaxID=323261 RepID=Q3JCG3_NITOC|nr:hypothetical protein [Nitrosococcus oceani]ABA57483.1 hypothetical protein Noc_0973 [Nitrosococcus oceani ATCC 19707]